MTLSKAWKGGTSMTAQRIVSDGGVFLEKVRELRERDARFITITVIDCGDRIEAVYHFDTGSELVNLRLEVPKEEGLPSITSVYSAAFVAENEVQDQYKIKVSGLSLDLKGRMLKSDAPVLAVSIPSALEGGTQPTGRKLGRCRESCPAMVNVPKYVRQIAAGDIEGAYNTILERAPFPAILGRVCFAACERGCRQYRDERPVRCRLLKRYAADSLVQLKQRRERAKPTGKRVAVVGGGPAGLTAAYYLGLLGHEVTVFEKRGVCGGAMLAYIPRFRLPQNVLDAEIAARIEEAGIRVEAREVESLENLFRQGFDAVFVAIGAQKGLKLMIEGEDSPGVYDVMEILSEINVYGRRPEVGKIVAVIGGGDGAVDAARVCRRLGAESVTVFYRRSREEMPASLDQVEAAMAEGVDFMCLASPVRIIPGKPLKVVFQKMQLAQEKDEKGRRKPVPLPGSEFTIEADTVIRAIGQRVDLPKGFNLEVDERGFVATKDKAGATSMKGVWAGGDAVVRPKSVIEGIKEGRAAASAIDKYLGGSGIPEPVVDESELVPRPHDASEILGIEPATPKCLEPTVRIKGFDEVEGGFERDDATREASRCWRCDWNE
ncbi:MAG: FAD-dependent oxidoreductase [Candidatus Verstraetearchaeota archaeon]|nr:FAD-dependent oxidoreductase [Candidatus Verstraetearchaeota archaeon]